MNTLENVIRKMDFEFFGTNQHMISPEEFLKKSDSVFLDVRSNEEIQTVDFKLMHYVNVLHIPTNEVPDRLLEIPKDKFIGIFCSSCVRSVIIYAYLLAEGYTTVKNISGGYSGIMDALKPRKIYKHIKNKG